MLSVRLLGALGVELNGTAIDSPVSQRPWAVFAYVALAGRPVTRSELANRFWPDVLDQSARASLRSALWAIRRILGDALSVDGERVALSESWVDVEEFERLASSAPEAALELCGGELLEGLEDDWAALARDRHRERVIGLLEELAAAAEARGELTEAIELTRRQVDRDPFDELVHRRLIERLSAAGDQAGAIRAYTALAERLRRELGVAVSAQTRELAEQLREAPAMAMISMTSAPEWAGASAARRAGAPESTPAHGFSPAGLLALVGRDGELAALERAWRSHGTAATIHGEAGIGKTRLAAELRARAAAAGARTAGAAALDLGGSAPLSLWAELLGELLPALPAPPPEAAWPDELAVLSVELPEHFGRAPRAVQAVAPDLQRTRLFEAIASLLGFAAREAPLLLVLEDLHCADAPSLELIAYAARRLQELQVTLLLTRRPQPAMPAVDALEQALRGRGLLACELELEPLAGESVASLARAAAELAEDQVQLVVAGAEGNALLAVESARALAGGRDRLAPSLRANARAALAPLEGDVRTVVETAAVAARPLRPEEVTALPVEDPELAATGALDTGMLVAAAGTLGFRHALVREAVYEEIAEPRRRGLHQRWARALLAAGGATPRNAEVARQLRLAGADPEAAPHLIAAAADARAVAALEQACAYLDEALSISPDDAEAWLELGEIEAWRIRRDAAEAAFGRGLELLAGHDLLTQARGHLRRARAYHGPICVPRAVLDSAGQALELLDELGDEAIDERSEAVAALAWAEAVAGSVDRAESLLERLSTLPGSGGELRTYDAGHARALALMRRGLFAESYEPSIAAGEAIAGAGRPDLAYGCWANAAGAATAAGELDRALEFLDHGLEVVADAGLESLEAHLLAERSFVLLLLGRLPEAREAADAETVLAERLGQPELVAMASHDRGLVALAEGEYEPAASLLERSLIDGAPISRPQTRLALAEAYARAGNSAGATDQIRATVLEPTRASDFPEALVPRLARVQGLVALAAGDRDAARRRLEEAIAGWERLVERTVRADSITSVLADLGRPVVGLIDPDRELARARADLDLALKGGLDALVS